MSGLLVYDGGCGMCTSAATFAARRLRPSGGYSVAAYQDADLDALGLTEQECAESVRFVDAGGRRYAAQDAVARTLIASRWWARPLGAAILVPGIHAVAGVVYHWVSRHRDRMPGGTPACRLPEGDRPH